MINSLIKIILYESNMSRTSLTAVKRARGRPRRYPPPGQSNLPTQIPAVIIPGSNGPTIMMAPVQVYTAKRCEIDIRIFLCVKFSDLANDREISDLCSFTSVFKGISNMNALAEQIKNLPSIVTTKVVSPLAPKPATNVPIAVRVVGGGAQSSSVSTTTTTTIIQTSGVGQVPPSLSVDTSVGSSLSTSAVRVGLSGMVTSQASSNADTLSISQSVSDSVPSETLPAITMESDEIDTKEQIPLLPSEGNLKKFCTYAKV